MEKKRQSEIHTILGIQSYNATSLAKLSLASSLPTAKWMKVHYRTRFDTLGRNSSFFYLNDNGTVIPITCNDLTKKFLESSELNKLKDKNVKMTLCRRTNQTRYHLTNITSIEN